MSRTDRQTDRQTGRQLTTAILHFALGASRGNTSRSILDVLASETDRYYILSQLTAMNELIE